MTYVDAVSRIGQIQDQIASLSTAFVPTASTTSGTTAASAQTGAVDATSMTQTGASTGATSFQSALATAVGNTSSTGATGSTGSTALPASASTMLTSAQQQFASRLASDTGLDPGVVSAWMLAEESGGAAVSRQSANNNDWLNIGYTGSGTYGSSDAIWSDPTSAADATAGWLKGQNTIPGYGTASSGIQAILQTAGQSPSAQITALQTSGWAGSGYPDLPSLYQQVSG